MKTIDGSKIDFVKLGPDDRRAVERRDRRRERERLAVRIESRIRWLVMFLHGRGGQSQFSVRLSARLAERNGLREVQAWIADHPGGAGAVGGSSESSRYVMPRIALCCLHAARRSVPSAPAAALSSRET